MTKPEFTPVTENKKSQLSRANLAGFKLFLLTAFLSSSIAAIALAMTAATVNQAAAVPMLGRQVLWPIYCLILLLWGVGLALIHHIWRLHSITTTTINAPDHNKHDYLIETYKDLERTVDLTIMKQITFDKHSGILRYTKTNPSSASENSELQVHAADCPLFEAAVSQDRMSVEFRMPNGDDFDSLLLILRDNEDGFCWGSGVMVKFSQPRRLRELLAHQARLVDLGGMASAIVHEIKQPLYTIAIAAENLRLMLEKGCDDITDRQMSVRVSRISDQVDRARKIIERIAQYGRTDASPPEEIDAAEIIILVHDLLAPMMTELRIAAQVRVAPGSYKVMMSPIALEQVLVNAMRNAADSIGARAAAGWAGNGQIVLEVTQIGRTLHCTISDNGIGLSPVVAVSAFNAFFTTKSDHEGSGLGLFLSRQIMIEANGSIRLLPRSGRGAVVELELPLSSSLS